MSESETLADKYPFMKLGLTVAVICAVADQVSKWWMLEGVFNLSFWPPQQGFPWVDRIELLPFFNLVTVWNQGVSFGLFSNSADMTRWILVIVTSAIAVGMMVWLTKANNRFLAFSLGLILGGAVGNIMDRIRFGAVFDFLDFFVGNYHWPAFNISDCAITVGAILVLLEGFIVKKDEAA
ncbi:signal peptidase II [Curvivirga aplysinae]|uniref:signal peptidase II n=1 Tax=Curvivirga aplysinae TaxID=2529852 RepID=UPI001F328CC9|nr:signal peptidase II [Curvivirga aplysinae]